MDLSKLELLESKVSSILTRLSEAEGKASSLGAELNEARERIRSLDEERTLILKKIDELLGRLDNLP
ncbi:MAG: hypothetical protein LBF40_11045 [Deltaproteobacteria bacterium]|jgi:chromosome segregation ATPase|nr:hypothetical protein [Deltaproteobacteria bacterium]